RFHNAFRFEKPTESVFSLCLFIEPDKARRLDHIRVHVPPLVTQKGLAPRQAGHDPIAWARGIGRFFSVPVSIDRLDLVGTSGRDKGKFPRRDRLHAHLPSDPLEIAGLQNRGADNAMSWLARAHSLN